MTMTDEAYKALGVIIPSLFSLIGVVFTGWLAYRVNIYHKTVNSKMDKLLTVSNAASKAEGKVEEKAEQKERDKQKE